MSKSDSLDINKYLKRIKRNHDKRAERANSFHSNCYVHHNPKLSKFDALYKQRNHRTKKTPKFSKD
ncbi:hypothetical protein A3Q56_03545 [Intoshia linei]|uniref:Uncharacterized protein n=1 Tax=Intoshia linei TaxID=1819745 RepID=A0A177B338_9BILA|nr:hypothetical protein A3Q56_03545 [Intoshia linei]